VQLKPAAHAALAEPSKPQMSAQAPATQIRPAWQVSKPVDSPTGP
jgi:hypothetical protein